MEQLAVQLGLIVVSIVGLWIGARLLVDAAVRLARRIGLSRIVVGLTVVALGTSAPEFVVSIDAAWKGFGNLAVGNVLGSNVYALAFVLGTVSLVQPIPLAELPVRREGLTVAASTGLAAIVLVDLQVTRVEGALLAAVLVGYTAYLLNTSADGGAPDGGVVRESPAVFRPRDAALLVGGLLLVVVSGDLLVGAASELARGAGVSDWVIGGTIVAAGTSTPELAVSLVAARRGRPGVALGNVVGSLVYNVAGVLGLAALVRPLAVTATALDTIAWLSVLSVLVVVALWAGRTLSRPEGAALTLSEVARWIVGFVG